MISYSHIFDLGGKEKKPASAVEKVMDKTKEIRLDKNSQKMIDHLNWKMKQHTTEGMNYVEDFDFCNEEIKNTLAKKNWNSLDKCFKWSFINIYLETNEISKEQIAKVKSLFVKNKLPDINFNNKERRIVALNITLVGQVL